MSTGLLLAWNADGADDSARRLSMLTTIAQVSQLSSVEAARSYPVRLRTLVTGLNAKRACFVQDDTGAIFLSRRGATNDLAPGQVVELEAVSDPGSFAPHLVEHSSRVVGQAPLPEPPVLAIDQPAQSARSLAQFASESASPYRVKVRGVVLHQQPGQFVYLRDGQQALLVRTEDAIALRPGDVIDALGFLALGPYSPCLEDAVYRKVGATSPTARKTRTARWRPFI